MTLILVFVLLMLIFGFVDFMFFVLVAVFLCCYVVKLGIAQKTETKKTPPKKWKYFRVFFTTQVMVACAKVIVFFGAVLLFFPCC